MKAQLFKSFCTDMYCSQLWSRYSGKDFNKLKVAYNNIFRGLMQVYRRESISKAFLDNNVDCFSVLIRKNIVSFRKRILSSENQLISAVSSSPFHMLQSSITLKWQKLAF